MSQSDSTPEPESLPETALQVIPPLENPHRDSRLPEALEVIVLDDRQYPYASSPSWQSDCPLPYQSQYPFRQALPRAKVYSVPRRFGMAALLALMTALACLFGALRTVETPPAVYLFLGTQVMVICVAQMLYNAEPRRASMIAGAILVPMFIAGAAFFVKGPDASETLCMIIPGIAAGAFAGYLIGTCVAGVFLLMDKLEPFLPGGKRERA